MRYDEQTAPFFSLRFMPSFIFIVVLLCTHAEAVDSTSDPTLWIVDDTSNTVYEVTVTSGTPTVLSSFPVPVSSDSAIAHDPLNNTLWGVNEFFGEFHNFTTTGDNSDLPVISLCDVRGDNFPNREDCKRGPEGIAVDFFNDTLWAVDDPAGEPSDVDGPQVYNFTKDGTLINSFSTELFGSVSPQSIAIDPFNGTLWITDNVTDNLYNVSTFGQLIAARPTGLGSTLTPPAINPQGITVDERNGSLWLTDRSSDGVYNIRISGTGNLEQLSFFASTLVDPLSQNPTGITVVSNLEQEHRGPLLPNNSNSAAFLLARTLIERTIDDASTPAEVIDRLENDVLQNLQEAFEKFLKGNPDQVAKKIGDGMKKLKKISDDFGFDTGILQNEITVLLLAQVQDLINRVDSIVGPEDGDLVAAKAQFDAALGAWREVDFELAVERANMASESLDDPDFNANFCPITQCGVYHRFLCTFQETVADIDDLVSENPGNRKLEDAQNALIEAMEKLAVVNVKDAVNNFRQVGKKLIQAQLDDVTQLLAAFTEHVADLVALFIDDAEASGHDPDNIEEAIEFFEQGELARIGDDYDDALEAYKTAVEHAKP